MYLLQFDGGSNPNPGPCAGAFVIFDEKNDIISEGGKFIENGTNNIGEYTGLIIGLKAAQQLNLKELSVQGDSLLVISQVNGRWKVNNEKLKILCDEVKMLSKNFNSIYFNHIPRIKNSHADHLSDFTLSKKQDWNKK